jgi:nitrous oxidase accessory protein NosD
VRVRGSHFLDNRITVTGAAINVWDAEAVDISENEVRGDGFGIAVVRADRVLIRGNVLHGDAAIHPTTSVRGIKVMGCFGAEIRGNDVSNYSNAIRTSDSGAVIIDGNTVTDSSPNDPTSYAIAVSNQHPDRERQGGHVIVHNVIRGSGGSGIYLGAGSPDCVVEDDEMTNIGNFGVAIFTDSPGNHKIRRNRIDNFDQANRGASGIYVGASATVEGNTISNSSEKKPAIKIVPMAKSSTIRDNDRPDGNPIIGP